MNEPRLEHSTLKIGQLIQEYGLGRIAIPEFQREYVWKPNKAPKLVDSLFRKFPISSLLLWENTTEGVNSRRPDPRLSRSGTLSWIIDGQQRTITLSRVLNGEQGIDLKFNPETEEFELANAANRKDPNWFRVSEIWDDEQYLVLRNNLPDGSKRLHLEKKFERVRDILGYEIPIVRMIDHSFTNAVKAFERINTLGVKLSKTDIESAYVAAKHTGFIRDEVTPFLLELRKLGFTRLNVMHLFRVCAFLAHKDGRNRTPLHELTPKEVNVAWKETKKATYKAIQLVRSELKLVNMEILWSGALLVPVIALCATQGTSLDAKEMIGWIALASLTHRYSGASDTALDQDLRVCRDSDPIGKLLTNLRREEGEIIATPNDFRGALMDRGGLLSAYIGCMNRGIKDFFSGGDVILQQNVDRHHILPRGQFSEKIRSQADCIANIAFINGSTNKSINMKGPEVYLKEVPSKILKSQCIPTEERLWKISEAEEFWATRRELLSESFNEFIKDSFPNRRKIG